jgi:uncharacterized protein YceH (UPF0502 family)
MPSGTNIIVDIKLTALEARVIGSLIEKEITTPEQYPLSLNALVAACNQKSNREPVMELDEIQVQEVVDALIRKHTVSEKTAFGSRVTKYRQRFCNTEFGMLTFTPQEVGLICVLLLRGAQTPGELRIRTARLCRFEDVQEVEVVLDGLMEREDGPFVARLAREPGKRESRYVQLFSDAQQPAEIADGRVATGPAVDAERIERLEQQVSTLFRELRELRERLDGLAAE